MLKPADEADLLNLVYEAKSEYLSELSFLAGFSFFCSCGVCDASC